MQDFRNLKVWQKAHELVLLVYQSTANFPRDELFGLRTQLRKTAVDIAGFLAEGSGNSDQEDFVRCVGMALGQASRLEYFALVASDLGLLQNDEYKTLNDRVVEVSKMLGSFWQAAEKE